MNITQKAHFSVLRNGVFQIDEYPSFSLFLDYLEGEFESLNSSDNSICFLERTLLYGSSLFTGLFDKALSHSIDISPSSANQRGAYNSSLVNSPDFLSKSSDYFLSQDTTSIGSNIYNYIFIPNLVHHFCDQENLYSICFQALKPNGFLIIYEPTIRELHQEPHDYLRFTPYGLKFYLEKAGFQVLSSTTEGNAYDAISYILSIMNAKRYDTNFLRKLTKIKSLLHDLQLEFPVDIVKPYSSFPTSFLIKAIKH